MSARRLPSPLIAFLLALCLALLPAAQGARATTVLFQPASDPIASPERGFWVHPGEFFEGWNWTEEGMSYQRAQGYEVMLALVVLRDFRDSPLSDAFLAHLEQGFAGARAAGIKLILRFSYNNPSPRDPVRDDAPVDRVLGHIAQLGPVLERNQDTLAVIQAGFIGLWGEGLGSTNGLTSRRNKERIRDALLAHFPAAIPLQWRRPTDLIRWRSGLSRPIGFHNDCFLASDDDMGTFPGTPARQDQLRRYMADLTNWTPFTAETCYDPSVTGARPGCAAILAEGAYYHLNTLNDRRDEIFDASWRAEGCLPEVERRLGYRLRLIQAEIGARSLAVEITNEGWSRVFSHRPLVATLWRDGRARQSITLGGTRTLGGIGPNETQRFRGIFPRRIRPGDALCLSSPDPHGPGTLAYSLRFANADITGQSWWDSDRGAFCFAAP